MEHQKDNMAWSWSAAIMFKTKKRLGLQTKLSKTTNKKGRTSIPTTKSFFCCGSLLQLTFRNIFLDVASLNHKNPIN